MDAETINKNLSLVAMLGPVMQPLQSFLDCTFQEGEDASKAIVDDMIDKWIACVKPVRYQLRGPPEWNEDHFILFESLLLSDRVKSASDVFHNAHAQTVDAISETTKLDAGTVIAAIIIVNEHRTGKAYPPDRDKEVFYPRLREAYSRLVKRATYETQPADFCDKREVDGGVVDLKEKCLNIQWIALHNMQTSKDGTRIAMEAARFAAAQHSIIHGIDSKGEAEEDVNNKAESFDKRMAKQCWNYICTIEKMAMGKLNVKVHKKTGNVKAVETDDQKAARIEANRRMMALRLGNTPTDGAERDRDTGKSSGGPAAEDGTGDMTDEAKAKVEAWHAAETLRHRDDLRHQAEVRRQAEEAKAARQPKPYTAPGPSGPERAGAPYVEPMPLAAQARATVRKHKAIAAKDEHAKALRAKEELRKAQQQERAEYRRKGDAVQRGA